jgi:3-methyl-2-oxobutanoate hydroxymethyltransferase
MSHITAAQLLQKKSLKQRISALTCYDATFAQLIDQHTDIDFVLVGDSLGMVIKGEPDTLNVDVSEIVYHTRAVSRNIKRLHVIADMPFLSYKINDKETLKNAGLLMKAGAHSIKLEGGVTIQNRIRRLVDAGIPVMGHIGLTPQSIHVLGGFRIQGKTAMEKQRLWDDAFALQDAGAFAVVIECAPEDIAWEITEKLQIPTIGIGAGKYCDGQILVLYDFLGLNPKFRPKFVKQCFDGAAVIASACQAYVDEVKQGTFPGPEHTYHFKKFV